MDKAQARLIVVSLHGGVNAKTTGLTQVCGGSAPGMMHTHGPSPLLPWLLSRRRQGLLVPSQRRPEAEILARIDRDSEQRRPIQSERLPECRQQLFGLGDGKSGQAKGAGG